VSASLRLSAEILELRTRHPFIIARGGQSEYRTVWVRLTDADGREGWGEAAATKYYGETAETVLAALNIYSAHMPKDAFDLEEGERAWEAALHGNAAARVALSSALHDLASQRAGVPLHRFWGLDAARAPQSTFTIGIDTSEKMQAKAREAAAYPILKVKLGTDRDLEILQALREVTDREIRVDANCAWTAREAIDMLPVLEEFGSTVRE
jgi:L-Ala-D/L-Glu epimerase